MNPTNFNTQKPNVGEKALVNNNHFNRQPRMKNYPYTTQWKDGKPIPNQTQSIKDKGTPDPLQRSSININDDVPWCIICQLVHSSYYYVVSQSFVLDQNAQDEKEEEEKSHDDVSSNMVSMCDDCVDFDLEEFENDIANQRIVYQLHHQQVFSDNEGCDEDQICVTSSKADHVNLKMPSKKEIDKVTAEMISQVHSKYNFRNRIVNNDAGKYFGIFIKDITHKMKNDNMKANVEITKVKDRKTKKWEPKKKVQFQTNKTVKATMQEKKSGPDTIKQVIVLTI